MKEGILVCFVASPNVAGQLKVSEMHDFGQPAPSPHTVINHLRSSPTICVRWDHQVMLGFILFCRQLSLLFLFIIVTLFSSSSAFQEFRPLLYRLVMSAPSSPGGENLLCANKRPSMELLLSKPTIYSFVLEFRPAVAHSLDPCVAGELRLCNELKRVKPKMQFRGFKLGRSHLAKDLRVRCSLSKGVHCVPQTTKH